MAISNLTFYRLRPYNYLYRENDIKEYSDISKNILNEYKNNKKILDFLSNFDYDLFDVYTFIKSNKIYEEEEILDIIKNLNPYEMRIIYDNTIHIKNTNLLKKIIFSIKEIGFNGSFIKIIGYLDKINKAEKLFDNVLSYKKIEKNRLNKQLYGDFISFELNLSKVSEIYESIRNNENILECFDIHKSDIEYIIEHANHVYQINYLLSALQRYDNLKNNYKLLDRLMDIRLTEFFNKFCWDDVINNYNEDIDKFIFSNMNSSELYSILDIKLSALKNETILNNQEYQEYILSSSTWPCMYILHVAIQIPEIRNDKEILEMIKNAPGFWCKEQILLSCLNEKILNNKEILRRIYSYIPNAVEMQKERLKYGETEFDLKLKIQKEKLKQNDFIQRLHYRPSPEELPRYDCKIKSYVKK